MYRFFEMSVLINLRRKRKIFFLPFTSRNVLFIYYYARRNKKIHPCSRRYAVSIDRDGNSVESIHFLKRSGTLLARNRARDIRRIFVHLTAAADQNSVAERKDTSEKKRKIDAISGCDATGIKTVRLRALAAL